MTTPIERAAEALQGKPLTGRRELNPEQADDAARAVFDSIDTNQLADVILAANLFGDGTAMDAALAVKNWLTGKEQQ